MLLIELISISNMGVLLTETCFCSRLYGNLFWALERQLSKLSTNHNGMLPGCIVYFDWLKFGKPEFQCKRQTDPYIAWFLFWKNELRCGILPLWTNEQIKRMLTNCTDITIALDAYGMPLNSSRNALNDWPSKQSYCWSIWCCKKISWSMLEKLFEKKDMLEKKCKEFTLRHWFSSFW